MKTTGNDAKFTPCDGKNYFSHAFWVYRSVSYDVIKSGASGMSFGHGPNMHFPTASHQLRHKHFYPPQQKVCHRKIGLYTNKVWFAFVYTCTLCADDSKIVKCQKKNLGFHVIAVIDEIKPKLWLKTYIYIFEHTHTHTNI